MIVEPEGAALVRDMSGELAADRIGDLLELVEPDKCVDFGDLPPQLVGIGLSHAPGDHQPLHLSSLFGSRHLEDRIDRLAFGVGDESAGIDEHDIGAVGVGGEFDTGPFEVPQHHLAVD